VKVRFELDPRDQQTFETEQVWAQRLGPNEFRILNSPFFVFGVSAEDVVEAAEIEEGIYAFCRMVMKGGHSTYRIFLQGDTISDEPFQSRWAAIEALGATFENGNSRFVSVDVPPSVSTANVYTLLQQGESDGVWTFEEADHSRSIG
jgi:hypothetical protein